MTRFRLAAVAALCIPALLVTVPAAPGGEAPRDTYRSDTDCTTRHRGDRDKAKFKSKVQKVQRGPGRRGTAAALVPVQGAKVITRMTDLVTADGNNVLDAKDSDLTNDNGVAKTAHPFNNFGNYEVKVKVKVDGDVVATDEFRFGVFDRESGECAPATEAPQ